MTMMQTHFFSICVSLLFTRTAKNTSMMKMCYEPRKALVAVDDSPISESTLWHTERGPLVRSHSNFDEFLNPLNVEFSARNDLKIWNPDPVPKI